MEYKIVKLDSIPKIAMAHTFQTTDNSWPLSLDPILCEITFIETGNATLVDERNGNILIDAVAPCIITNTHNIPQRMIVKSEVHRHYTIAFYVSKEPKELTETEITGLATKKKYPNNDYFAIFPRCITVGTITEKISKCIKSIIASQQSILVSDDLKSAKNLLDILTELTRYSLDQVRLSVPESFVSLYSVKAARYIGEHIEEKINVNKIAEELKISYGYLSRIFRESMGVTIVQYINEAKIKRVKELMITKNITLEEAGACVGIYDVKYLSRIFKQYSGMTVSEYKKHLIKE